MSSWARLAARFIRELGGRGKPQQSDAPPTRDIRTGAHAALAVEVSGSERILRNLAAGETRPGRDRPIGQNAFGAEVREIIGDDATATFAAATGCALGGQRAAVLMGEANLSDCHAPLLSAVARRVPLLVHAVTSADTGSAATHGARGHAAYHSLADAGAILALAEDAQQAVDKALIARRAAERALTCAVVGMDGPETAWAPSSLVLPDAELVREMLGAPGDEVDTPTPEQRFLFGATRRRVPRWFDPDRPASHGMQQSGGDLAVALAGQRVFVAKPVLEALQESIAEYERLTGSRLDLTSRYRMERADYVFVAQGVALGALRALSDYLLKERKIKVGVLGIEWLRPLDSAAIAEALRDAKAVAVLERTTDPLAQGGPLLREVQSAAAVQSHRKLLHAVYGVGGQPLANAELLALFEHMKQGDAGRRSVMLGVSPPEIQSDHPRREALTQRVRAEFPKLGAETLRLDALLDLRPEGAKSAAIWARESESSDLDLEAAAQAFAAVGGGFVKSRVSVGEQGTWTIELTAAKEAFTDPACMVWHDLAVVATPELPGALNPLSRVARQGQVLLASPLSPEALWKELPETWRAAIRERELRLFVCDAPLSALVTAIPWLAGAEERPALELTKLEWRDLAEAPARAEHAPPLAVRRFANLRRRYDNLPRFWTELALPRLERGGAEPAPDPYLSLAAVPPSTSSLFEVAVHKNRLPLLEMEKCIGCGACWTACPDSAIVPGVIGTEALLNAAADQAATPGAANPIADKLRRAHRQLAARVDGRLAKGKAKELDESLLRDSYAWLVEQMKVGADERAQYDQAFEATLNVVQKLAFAATEPFFHAPHADKKSSGELVTLSVNPAACQGCGGCSAVCSENAIVVGQRSDDAVQHAAAGWSVWERLPDPSGDSVARAASCPGVGNMAAVMSSRHTLLAVTGGGGHEPGSGARVGTRLVAAVAEFDKQRRMLTQVRALEDLSKRLKEALHGTLAGGLPSDDLAALERALDGVPDRTANVSALVAGLEKQGAHSTVDSEAARRLVAYAKNIDATVSDLKSGQDGMGRSRFGLVVAGQPLAEWAAEFPRNPFAVPVVVDLSSQALDVALGLAESMLARHAAQIRLSRLAEASLLPPADAAAAEPELEHLAWQQLSGAELSSCPAVIVLAGPEVFSAGAHAGLSRVLASRLPVKVVVLDGRERWLGSTEPVLPFVTQRRAFILSSTIAHHEHLFSGFSQALQHPGPALAHIYTPSPGRHGFDSADTVARARAAVDSRLHPLFVWDPEQPGVFGSRFSLAGNPAPASPWCSQDANVPTTPAHFALGEKRFAEHFVERDGRKVPLEDWLVSSGDERAGTVPVVVAGSMECVLDEALAEGVLERFENWRTLQELAGVVTPFTAEVSDRAKQEVDQEHRKAIEALRQEYEQKLAATRASQTVEATLRLRERLIQLAGYQRSRSGEEPS